MPDEPQYTIQEDGYSRAAQIREQRAIAEQNLVIGVKRDFTVQELCDRIIQAEQGYQIALQDVEKTRVELGEANQRWEKAKASVVMLRAQKYDRVRELAERMEVNYPTQEEIEQ